MSDGTNGHTIDLNIGSGSVTILGSLVESGGANISFSGAGTLNIYKDFSHSSGTFTGGGGTVLYNGIENQEVANINYNNLTINKVSGLAAIADTVNIAGNLLIAHGELETYSTTTVSGDVTINAGGILNNQLVLHVQGNWNNNGSYISTGASVFFDGSGPQNISASTFNNFIIDKPSDTARLTGNVTTTGNLHLYSGVLDLKTFTIDRNVLGGFTTHTAAATLMIGANNPPKNYSSHVIQGSTVFYGDSAQFISFPGITFADLVFKGTGIKYLLSDMIVTGDLIIASESTFNAGANPFTLSGNWINNGTLIPATSTLLLNGISKTITGVTTFNNVTIAGSYTILNNVTFNGLLNITNTGSLSGGGALQTTLHGDLINSGVLNALGTTTFSGNVVQTLSLINSVQTVAITVNFNGTISPVLNSTSAPQYGFLNINNTGGINASVGYTIAFALNIGNGASFNGGPSTHNILGSVTNNGAITSSGTLNFIPSGATSINLGNNFSSTGTVIFGGTGAVTMAGSPASFNNIIVSNTNALGIAPASGWNIVNNLTLNTGSKLNAGNYAYTIGGNIANRGVINPGASTFTLNGAGVQDIYTVSPFNNLSINKAVGSVILSSNATVNGALNFISGKINTGNNVLRQQLSGTVSGASGSTGWVNGRFQKMIAAGSTLTVFEIGDTLNYTPFSLAFTGVTTPGDITASTTTGDHPAIGSSFINPVKSVNRFWTLENTGVVAIDYDVTYNFLAAEVDAGANTSSFGVSFYDGLSWIIPVTGSANPTNIQATGVRGYGDFAVGEICNSGTSISYPDSPYCSNAGTALVIQTGSGSGVYTSTPGLSINSVTGTVDLLASIPDDYLVTYTVSASGGCSAYSTTATITISQAPAAAISYPGSPYCVNAGVADVTFSGVPGGIFRSTTGLAIDSTTGDVSLGTSAAGIYTVIYTLAAVGGCVQYQVSANIAVSDPSVTTINYPASPYCSDTGIITVTQNGIAGGVYTSAPGLSINASTGSINTATSTADIYTVTYTVAPANGCGEYLATTSVTINSLPSATIVYNGSPFCNLPGIESVTISGTGGGTYTSTAGLSINAVSGDINTGSSLTGTYTVTYTISAAGGCGPYSTTTILSISVPGTWTGAVNNDWNMAGNWLCGSIPVFTTNVNIPGNIPTYPVINTGVIAINNLIIQPGASLTVTGAKLQIAGSVTSAGTLYATNGTLEMNGSSSQIIPAGIFYGNTISGLTINNNAGVTLAGSLGIYDVVTITNGSLASDGYLTLISTANATARVAPITSAALEPISGNVIVERYVPGRRKYRLISSSVTTSTNAVLSAGQEGLSIWGNWQNQGNNVTLNSGTIITGGSNTDGFDTQTSNTSLYTYDNVNRRFTGFNSANGKNTKYTPLKAGDVYYMFVYGDRTNSVSTSNPKNTVIRSSGKLLTGNQVYNTSSSIALSNVTGRFTLLGNPFVSPIDWTTLPKTDLSNTYWGWDPNLSSTGGYITVSTTGSVTLISPYSGTTGLNQYIQPGQGFFVQTSGPAPALTIREQDKLGNFNGYAFRTNTLTVSNNKEMESDFQQTAAAGNANTIPLMAINLFYNNAANKMLADGALVAFAPDFSKQVGKEDAIKIPNNAESIAILNEGQLLSIDARQMPQEKDTLFLQINRLVQQQYILQVFARQLDGIQVQPYLQDNYLHTVEPLLIYDTNRIAFAVTSADPASGDINRFRILFGQQSALPAIFTSIRATRKEKYIQLDWSVAGETGIDNYQLERSADGINFIKAGEVKASISQGIGNYQWLDLHPFDGINFYRIRYIHPDSRYFFSKIVSINMDMLVPGMSIFPNPVKNQQINLHINRIQTGRYTLLVSDAEGKRVGHRIIEHTGESSHHILWLQHALPAGIYHLQLLNGKIRYSETIYLE